MTAFVPTNRRRSLGEIPNPSAAKRNTQLQDAVIADVGAGFQEGLVVTLEPGETKTVRHGLQAVPDCVTLTPLNAPAPDAFEVRSQRSQDSVTVTNSGGSAVEIELGLFG